METLFYIVAYVANRLLMIIFVIVMSIIAFGAYIIFMSAVEKNNTKVKKSALNTIIMIVSGIALFLLVYFWLWSVNPNYR